MWSFKNMRVQRICAALVIALSMLFSACGFHFRGQQSVPENFSAIMISDAHLITTNASWSSDGRDVLRRTITQAFLHAGITARDNADITVELLGENIERRTASINAVAASAAEYRLEYALRYRVIGADGAILIADTQLTTDNSYRFNDSAVLGSADEEALIFQEMRRDLANRLVRQYLHRINANASKQTPPTTPADARPANATAIDATHAPAP